MVYILAVIAGVFAVAWGVNPLAWALGYCCILFGCVGFGLVLWRGPRQPM